MMYPDFPVAVLGAGNIGRAFIQGSFNRATVVRRGESLPWSDADPPGPIIVAVRNSELVIAIQQVPPSRWDDLVFIQNGILRPWQKDQNLEKATNAVLYMAAKPEGLAAIEKSSRETAALGSSMRSPLCTEAGLQVGVTDGGGKTVVHGRWSAEVASLLQRVGVAASTVSSPVTLATAASEKLLWSSTFWLLCAVHGNGTTVGDVAAYHRMEVRALVAEMWPAVRSYLLEEVLGPKLNGNEGDDMILMTGSSGEEAFLSAQAQQARRSHAHEGFPRVVSKSAIRSRTLTREDSIGAVPGECSLNDFVATGLQGDSIPSWFSAFLKGPLSRGRHEQQEVEANAADQWVVDALTDELCAYSLAISDAVPSVAMALDEFGWRNGWFLRQGGKEGQMPLHRAYLARVGAL